MNTVRSRPPRSNETTAGEPKTLEVKEKQHKHNRTQSKKQMASHPTYRCRIGRSNPHVGDARDTSRDCSHEYRGWQRITTSWCVTPGSPDGLYSVSSSSTRDCNINILNGTPLRSSKRSNTFTHATKGITLVSRQLVVGVFQILLGDGVGLGGIFEISEADGVPNECCVLG